METPATMTTLAPFVPPVASPFTTTELNYLNALAVAGLNPKLGAEHETRVSAEGTDTDGDGRTDMDGTTLDRLDDYVAAVRFGHSLCDLATRALFITTETDAFPREEREATAIIAEAYLC